MQYNRLLRGEKKSTCTFANLLFHIQTERQSQPVKNVNNLIIRQGITNNNHIWSATSNTFWPVQTVISTLTLNIH